MFFNIFKNEIKKNLYMIVSYPLNAILSIFLLLSAAIIVLFSIKSIFQNTLDFYGMIFLPIITSSFNSLHNNYKFDTLIGVIDQILTSKFGLEKTYFVRYIAEAVLSILPTLVLVLIAKSIFAFEINSTLLCIAMVMIVFGGYFVSKVLLGLTMFNRNIDSLNTIINILVVSSMASLTFSGIENINLLIFSIPFSSLIVIPYIPFSPLNYTYYVCIFFNLIVSCLLANIFYSKLMKKSLMKGTIGQY